MFWGENLGQNIKAVQQKFLSSDDKKKEGSICCPSIIYLTMFSPFHLRQDKFQSKVILNKKLRGLMGKAERSGSSGDTEVQHRRLSLPKPLAPLNSYLIHLPSLQWINPLFPFSSCFFLSNYTQSLCKCIWSLCVSSWCL